MGGTEDVNVTLTILWVYSPVRIVLAFSRLSHCQETRERDANTLVCAWTGEFIIHESLVLLFLGSCSRLTIKLRRRREDTTIYQINIFIIDFTEATGTIIK